MYAANFITQMNQQDFNIIARDLFTSGVQHHVFHGLVLYHPRVDQFRLSYVVEEDGGIFYNLITQGLANNLFDFSMGTIKVEGALDGVL